MTPVLHSQTWSQLNSLKSTLAGSYIFHGPRSVGKATTARHLAQQLNCMGHENGVCAACKRFESGSYPDFLLVQPEDRPSILIEQVRGLIQALSLGLYHPAGVRIVLIDDADMMTTEAQNALLKLIEEPPPRTMFILIAKQLPALLPTVRSRCGLIYFPRLTDTEIANLLTQNHGVPGPEAAKLATAANGAAGEAIALVGDAGLVTERLELSAAARSALAGTLFERLVLAGKLAATKADLSRFGQALHADITGQLREGTADIVEAERRLTALERYRRQLHAKVSPKVTLERLMLDL